MSCLKINNVKLVTSWSFNLNKNTECTICRQHLNTFSIYAKDSNITEIKHCSGSCGHTFHKECIIPWLNKSYTCPICSKSMNSIINSIGNSSIQ